MTGTARKLSDGGPAFPYAVQMEGFDRLAFPGMSLRDWFAGQQLCRVASGWPNEANMQSLAENCYAMADAMLAARAALQEHGQ